MGRSVMAAGKRYLSFHRPSRSVWIASDWERRISDVSLKTLIVVLENHFVWWIPLPEIVLVSPVRSASINVGSQKGNGVTVV